MITEEETKQATRAVHETVHDIPSPLGTGLVPLSQSATIAEALLRLLAEDAQAILWSTDPGLRLMTCAGNGLSALSIRADQVTGTNLLDHLPADLPEPPILISHRQALQGQSGSCEVVHGSFTYRVHVGPLPGPEGAIAGCVGIALDVTPDVEAQESAAAQQRLFGLIGDIGAALGSTGSPGEVLRQCTAALVRRLGVSIARIWTVERADQVLHLQASSGASASLDDRCTRIAPGRLRVGLIAQSSHPYLTNDLLRDPRREDREWARREGMSSFAGHPLVADGRVVGVLAVFGERPFGRTTLDELAAVASSIAQYVERKRAEQERSALLEREREARTHAAEAVRRAAFLAQASLALDSSMDFHGTLEQVARLAVPVLADWCLVDVVEEGGTICRHAAASDLTRKYQLDELARRYSTGHPPAQPTALLLQTGKSLLLPECGDVATLMGPPRDAEHQRLLGGLQSQSLLAVPLQARGQLFGVITLVSTRPERRYDAGHLSLAEDFARRCGLAVDNARLLEYAQREVAERRWAEETLLRSEEHLRQSSKMEAVGRLAAGVAHDFNNILTAILGYAEILRHRFSLGGPELEMAEAIHKSGERAARLTRQLLTFSRKQTAQLNIIHLNALLANLEGLLRQLLGVDLQFHTMLEPTLGHIRADSGQVEQVVVNLAVNARDAMLGGGTLTIETRNVEVDASWSHLEVHPGPYVLLRISDTGHGMTEEVKRHLFEPFFTTKGPGAGTGLGLAITYGIITQAGGYIDVQSEPGHGTTFNIYLPRVETDGSPTESHADATRSTEGTETILLVEDDEAIRGLVSKVLRTAGYTVLEAADGEEALRVATNHPAIIDLLVTDVVMPRLGGRESAERLTDARPGLRVLYLSGHTDAVMPRQGIQAAVSDFLPKPFTPQALARKVRQVLDRETWPDR